MADIQAVKRWESTDDLLQNASLRLWKAIETHHPPTPTDFFRLAACVMRRELIDLSRSHYGPLGWGANHHSPRPSDSHERPAPGQPACQESDSPEQLRQWTEFHTYIEKLPDDERQLFDLLWYQGLTLNETSDLLGIPLRTLGRAWKLARIAAGTRSLPLVSDWANTTTCLCINRN